MAYKLATQGVLGSDLYAGFFGADQHFFITLPLQHVFEAFSFRLFGAGVGQARWVSLVAGVSIVWLVGGLAFRWYGLGAALLCEILLVAWPSNLTAALNGLPVLGVSRTARYDVLAVAAGWLAIAWLDVAVRRPRPSNGIGLGVCCGLAALSQFMGTFVLPLVIVNWLLARGRPVMLGWIMGGAAAVVLPWLGYLAWNASDLAGQLTVYAGRGEFLRPGFYVENITQEAGRYEHVLANHSPSGWLLLLGVGPAVAYVAWRSWRSQVLGDRVVWSSLVIFGGLLLLFDHGKSSVYAIVLVPSICLALARLAMDGPSWVWRHSTTIWGKLGAVALGVELCVAVLIQSQPAYQLTLAQAEQVSPYAAVGQRLERALVPGARVLGPERWWWALHEHPYLSLRSLWWQWPASPGPMFTDGVSWADADNVIVNDNVRDDLLLFPETVQRRFRTFLSTCTTRTAEFSDETYFGIEVYHVTRPSPDPALCR